jgi:hypothetical protein
LPSIPIIPPPILVVRHGIGCTLGRGLGRGGKNIGTIGIICGIRGIKRIFGLAVGRFVGLFVGIIGFLDGLLVGFIVGIFVGFIGLNVGINVGVTGDFVGIYVGLTGAKVGLYVGLTGAFVGTYVGSCCFVIVCVLCVRVCFLFYAFLSFIKNLFLGKRYDKEKKEKNSRNKLDT